MLSPCYAFARDELLCFLIYDIATARSLMSMILTAERKGLSSEVLAANRQLSGGFWQAEQDYLADIVRQMDKRCGDPSDETLYAFCHLGPIPKRLRFPNVFITIAPGEWNVPLPIWLRMFANEGPHRLSDIQAQLGVHLHNALWSMLDGLLRDTALFEEVYEHVLRVEFQGRGTLHVHLALWAIVAAGVDLRGRSGEAHSSPIIHYLERLGYGTVDVQYGEGFLNYINGYTAKAQDSLDFRLTQHTSETMTAWRQCYRLLCKQAPCLPEIACRFAKVPMMRRSFEICRLFPCAQGPALDLDQNASTRSYREYLQHYVTDGTQILVVQKSFLAYARGKSKGRGGRCRAIGIRFAYEMQDRYIGQYATVFYPHCRADSFIDASGRLPIDYTRHFVGVMCFLEQLRYGASDTSDGRNLCYRGDSIAAHAFPHPLPMADNAVEGELLFGTSIEGSRRAFDYLVHCLLYDVEIRCPEPGRRQTLSYRLQAFFDLRLFLVREQAQQTGWDMPEAIRIAEPDWSDGQKQALDAIEAGLCPEDASEHRREFLHIAGTPGSGKSEVIAHAAMRASAKQLWVLILCPTGNLVHSYMQRITGSYVVVETLHAGFAITRKAEEVVMYSPPTRLRRYDLILIDEASQIDDDLFKKIFMALQELPQRPVVAIAADFCQLRPVTGGSLTMRACQTMRTFTLTRIFRCNDPGLLDYCAFVRENQPNRAYLEAYWTGRQFLNYTLPQACAFGERLSQRRGKPFTWLCVTNAGAQKVNEAIVEMKQFAARAPYEPFKAEHGGTVRLCEGVLLRLSRNMDKPRGYVNGAMATVEHVFSPAVAIIRLHTGTKVLLHPIWTEDIID